MVKKYNPGWVQILTGRNSENMRYFLAMRKVQTTWQSLDKNRCSMLNYYFTEKSAYTPTGRASNREAPHQKIMCTYCFKEQLGHRYTGNPLKRVIFHFAEMSYFLPLKCPFISAHWSSQSAQTSFAVYKGI